MLLAYWASIVVCVKKITALFSESGILKKLFASFFLLIRQDLCEGDRLQASFLITSDYIISIVRPQYGSLDESRNY